MARRKLCQAVKRPAPKRPKEERRRNSSFRCRESTRRRPRHRPRTSAACSRLSPPPSVVSRERPPGGAADACPEADSYAPAAACRRHDGAPRRQRAGPSPGVPTVSSATRQLLPAVGISHRTHPRPR
jgi:hypothetical protein